MNRTERLYAVAEELRRAGRQGTSGPRLARLLEVSERTIKRDVSALQQAGLPIWAQPGPGGGYVLDAVATLPPVNFTPAQAVAVAVALAAMPPGSPFTADGVAARGKVFDALGPGDRERARELAARVWLDAGHARDGGTSVPGSAPADASGAAAAVDAPVLRAVEESLGRHLVLTIRYRSRADVVTRRQVEPILLAHARGRWHLIAWARDRDAVRWFRLEAIEKADVTRERYEPRPVAVVGEPPPGAAPAVAR
ncbi:WYL domain-containing protein [Actinotalea ferrariae]|uniref:helix-turn-helix transcriptional regulator n=1 Tax=Actinotalea ferrariae TaxID=1386098 RepID=UPI001C8B1A5A|nr:WYL domain-containing protein [Actinotalea ferrariae]MBX9243486.1 WYL domain-containing protein [Actinotalea ferrariae]